MPSPAPAGRAPLPRSAQGCEFHCRQHGRKSSTCKSRSRAGGRCSITIASCFPDQAAAIRLRPRRSGSRLVAVISLTFQCPDSPPSPYPSPTNAAGLPASLRTAGIDSSRRVSPLSPRPPMHQLRAHLHQIRTPSFLASTFPVEPCPFPLEMRRIELEMPTFPLQARNIQLEMCAIDMEIRTFPHQHRAMHGMSAPFPSSPGRVGMEICEVGLETGKVDLQERELPLESGAPYRQGCWLHLQGRESARQRHGLRRTGREFRRPRRRMRLQGHALRLQACAACSCRHRLRPSTHAVCLQARRLDGGIANFKAAAAYLHPPAASRIAPDPSCAPLLRRQAAGTAGFARSADGPAPEWIRMRVIGAKPHRKRGKEQTSPAIPRRNVRKLYFFPNLSMIWITAPVIVAGTVASETAR